MFKIDKGDKQLSFSIEKENSVFGDGTKILFWIDMELGTMQRGRQEYILLSSISTFKASASGDSLCCTLGSSEMTLYSGSVSEKKVIEEAVKMLNSYCGLK